MNRQQRDIIALSMVPGLGARRIALLLSETKDTEDIFTMSGARLKEVTGRDLAKPGLARNYCEVEREADYVESKKINVTSLADEDYPLSLRDIYDPPPILFYRGCFDKYRPAVAIVGSRRCTAYGLQMAESLAYDLAVRGVTVVSGMARGIDQAAHRGALNAGGRTIAVMGSGFSHIYPPGSEQLAEEIAENGAVMTEFLSDVRPERFNFPRRNRIISGLSDGVVVVEAARKSGAMITVDYALDQGKDVFAVPGRADLMASSGTNKLIQSGAKLVTRAEDIIDELNVGDIGYGAFQNGQLEKASAYEQDQIKPEIEGII